MEIKPLFVPFYKIEIGTTFTSTIGVEWVKNSFTTAVNPDTDIEHEFDFDELVAV